MHFQIITLFPYYFNCFFRNGLMARAIQKGIIDYTIVNLRKFGEGAHQQVDDVPFGGKGGMLLKEKVLKNSKKSLKNHWTIFLSPQGKKLTAALAKELAEKPSLTFICGHYEGVDQRFIDQEVDQEISIGDYVLFQGESAAVVLMEVIARYLKGFLGNANSSKEESFENGLLEHDQFTRPYDQRVPEVLVSGHHQAIKNWKKNNQIFKTLFNRPQLFKEANLSEEEERIFKQYIYNFIRK